MDPSETVMPVAVIGLGRTGVVGAACLADWGCHVVAADRDFDRIRSLARGQAPLPEPGLVELIQQGIRAGRLSFTNSLESAVTGAGVVLFMHDAPIKENDERDLNALFRDANDVAPGLQPGVVLHVNAQVPVGTTGELAKLLKQLRPGLEAYFAYSPLQLTPGEAVEQYRHPLLPVLGTDGEEAFLRLKALYAPSQARWLRCSIPTAEMTRHVLSSFQAVSLSWARELTHLCETVGVDLNRVADLLGHDPRVGGAARLWSETGSAGESWFSDAQLLRRLGVSAGRSTPLLDLVWNAHRQESARQRKREEHCS